MMMRASPRFTHYSLQIPFRRTAHDTINPFSLLPFSTHRSSSCWKQHLHTCGFASAAAEARLRFWVYSLHPLCIKSKGKVQDPPSFLLKAHLSHPVYQFKTSALSSACISTSSCLEVKSYACAAPINAQPSVKGARKGTSLQSETGAHPSHEISVHGERKFGEERCMYTNTGNLKVSESNASVSICDLNGESWVTQQNGETSIENETVPSQAREEEKAIYSETCIEEERVVARSSPACKETEAMDGGDAYLKNIKIPKRFQKNPEAIVIPLKLNMCSKFADLHHAIELYDQVKREGLVCLNLHSYNVLLYICSGAASGSLVKEKKKKRQEATTLQSNQPDHNEIESLEEDAKELVHFSPEDRELATTRGAEILEDMLQQGIEPNETTFTSIIRFAIAKNDGDLAFETIKLMASRGIRPKLRSYGPPLLCFCESNQVDKAFELDDHMQESGVLPDESMLDSLLRVSIEARLENRVYSLLQRLRISVRDLMPTTVKTVEKWFNSEAAASAGKAKWEETLPSKEELRQATEACGGGWHGLGWLGKGAWQVKRTNISKTGSCLSCSEVLCTIDLDPKDTENFANSVVKIASQKEKQPRGFKAFQEWLHKHGPFDAIVDGANVGLYNPQIHRGFCFNLLNAVVKAVSSKISTQRPPLILLHSRHGPRMAQTKADEQILNKWRKENGVYFTPFGSNDDWFWLYAAVKCNCLLITNDKMRDHIFELLGNDFFPKWKERHQVQFTFTAEKLELHMPPPYSIVIQESQNGSWHVPQAGGDDIEKPREWLCVTRAETIPSV